jgi:hypothetical protein
MSDSAHSLLVNIIATPRGGLITPSKLRRYQSAIRTWTTLGQRQDARVTNVTYEIDRRQASSKKALAQPGKDVPRIDASYETNSAEAELFTALARKYSNFSGSFKRSSLAGVAQRLALALSAQSVFGDVTSDSIRGNLPLRVTSLDQHDTPVTSLTNAVFVPRVTDTQVTQDTWAVLINAIAGEGSAIVTDLLFGNATTRQVIVPTVNGQNVTTAIVSALQLVGANMVASGQGPLFALSVTRGIHMCVSVVGHTDEGGITRDLLRCAAFSAPYGGINPRPVEYTGLPTLAASSVNDVAGYVDSIAMATAAAVAYADPGQRYNGEWFPQFFSAPSPDEFLDPGEHEDPPAGAAAANRAALVSSVSQFSELYVRALSRVYGVDGDILHASGFFNAAAHSLEAEPRHLNYATVTPWFWIEPTSLLPPDLIDSDAALARCGALAPVSQPATLPALDGLRPFGPGDFLKSGYRADIPSARRAGLLLHFWGHPQNGVSSIVPRQLDVGNVVQPGPCSNGGPADLHARLRRGRSLDDYLWTRGQSPFPAPGEFMNLSVSMGFVVKHVSLDNQGDYHTEHIYQSTEFIGAEVSVLAARPTGIDSGPSNSATRDARRARTRAAAALSAAKRRIQIFGTNDTGEMPVICAAPPREPQRALPPQGPTGVGAAGHSRAGPDRDTETGPHGPPVAPELRVGAVPGPRPLQGGVQRVPGGAPPPNQTLDAPAAPAATETRPTPAPAHADDTTLGLPIDPATGEPNQEALNAQLGAAQPDRAGQQ